MTTRIMTTPNDQYEIIRPFGNIRSERVGEIITISEPRRALQLVDQRFVRSAVNPVEKTISQLKAEAKELMAQAEAKELMAQAESVEPPKAKPRRRKVIDAK